MPRFPTRNDFLQSTSTLVLGLVPLVTLRDAAGAFEGGIGGLGKTKPATGIVLWNEDGVVVQDVSTGEITAELNVAGQPVLVSYAAPWPLLAGLEARNIATAESTFVQVIENYAAASAQAVTTKSGFLDFLLNTVFSSQGKFGAYAAPFDVKIVPSSLAVGSTPSSADAKNGITVVTANVTFTTYTPGLRESERQVLVKAVNVFGRHWILLVAGAPRLRFRAIPPAVWNDILDSFQVTLAPTSQRRRS